MTKKPPKVLDAIADVVLRYRPKPKSEPAKQRRKRTLTLPEVHAYTKALQAIDAELGDLYTVGVGTLLRQETLLGLRGQDHRGDRLVVTTKTGPHQVPLTGPTPLQRAAARVLRRRQAAHGAGRLFPTWAAHFARYDDSGHPRRHLLNRAETAARRIGVPWGLAAGGIVWHTATRATGATLLLRHYRIDIRTVQLIGGWSSLDQMATYLGVDRTVLGGVVGS